jgi:hypothetical protein
MILVREHHFELCVRSNPRQNIAYGFFYCDRPVFLSKQKWVRFNLGGRKPLIYQEDREDKKATECKFHEAAPRSIIYQTDHSKIPHPLVSALSFMVPRTSGVTSTRDSISRVAAPDRLAAAGRLSCCRAVKGGGLRCADPLLSLAP